MSKTVIIIPSRLSAKRLPNKPLLKINGKSIISLVYLKAVACKIGRVIVATEDKKISDEIKKYNGNVILTSKKHQSGTDRIWEAFKKLKDKNLKYIINLQGDEPTICPNDIMRLNKSVIKNKFDICTLASKIKNNKSLSNKNIVKVITKQKINYILTARNWTCPSLFMAKSINKYSNKNVWFYSFDKIRDGIKSKEMGAYHGAELPYIFNTHDDWLPTSSKDLYITKIIQNYWINFLLITIWNFK